MSGPFNAAPRRMGGAPPLIATILESLNASMGSAYDTSVGTGVYIRNVAIAMAIAGAWESRQRFINELTPGRSIAMTERWARIFRLRFQPSQTEPERRRAIARAFARICKSSVHASLTNELRAELGDIFVAIEYISIDIARQFVPEVGYPWGEVLPGRPWGSTMEHVLVRLQKPDSATDAEFDAATRRVTAILDSRLPSTQTFDWYRAPDPGTPINVPGGPSAAGFYLGQAGNLGNHVFDE